jgi:hypothetical protein
MNNCLVSMKPLNYEKENSFNGWIKCLDRFSLYFNGQLAERK